MYLPIMFRYLEAARLRQPWHCNVRDLGFHLAVLGVVFISKVTTWTQMAAGAPAIPFSFQPEVEGMPPLGTIQRSCTQHFGLHPSGQWSHVATCS